MFKLRALPRTLAAAERDLAHADAKVRESALRDLAHLKDEAERRRASELACAALLDADVDVRSRAALILADLNATHCVPDLVRLLGDVHVGARQMALVSLGELATPGDEVVVGRLGAFLTVGEAALRFQALAAWARLAPERLAEVLGERLEDADAEIRALALRLAHEHWVDAGQELSDDLSEGIRRRLEDPVPGVRLVAAVLLGRAGLRTSPDILIAAAARRLRAVEPIDEQEAIALCGELRLQRAAPALRRRAFGLWGFSRDPFVFQAKIALALLGDERARASILEGLSARSWHVRALSADAAGRARLTEALPRLVALREDPQIDTELVERAIASLEGGASVASAAR